MKFELNIDSRNAAFTGGGRAEVARLLRKTADEVEHTDDKALMDINGNRAGCWHLDDEAPDFFEMEAEELFQQADDMEIDLDDDPRKLSRAELIEGLESIGVACYDEESDELLAAAYGDSMLAGDLGDIDRLNWVATLTDAWEE